MDRKRFLSSLAGAPLLLSTEPAKNERNVPEEIIIPSYLKKGDQIGVTSPAGFITVADIQPALQQMTSWGLRVKLGTTIGKRNFGFGGTDSERLKDLQQMLDDSSLKAIMCARGGYGVIRIIDGLNFTRFRKNPKWLIGFSDITVLHAHINTNYGIASIHSKMCNSFPEKWNEAEAMQQDTIYSIRDALMGIQRTHQVVPSQYNRAGTAEGVLVGGNLKMIESLAGSDSDLYTNGKILFVEDTGEYLYSIDRMFWNLKRSGKLVGLKGLIIGGFKIKPDDPGEEFGIPLQQIVMDKVKEYHFPVCFDFPVGHQKNNFALKCGSPYRLRVTPQSCTLEELNSL
jgi:muramoyltetrapeptide carboxypeptidase